MLNRPDVAGFSSVLSFPKTTFPAYSFARLSMTGATILHGPHHGAQKSTSINGCSFMKESKVESVTVTGVSGDLDVVSHSF